jgi:LysM repeat protein
MIYHNGWWHDYNIVFKRFIDDSLTIIILSNKFNQAIYKTEYVETALLEKNNFFDTNLNKVLYAKKEDEEDDVEENKSIIELNPFNYITNNTIVSTNSKSSDNQNVAKNSKPNVYVVKKGDTLFNIAQKFDITIETLKKWNKMATANIQLGQKLFIEKLNGNE